MKTQLKLKSGNYTLSFDNTYWYYYKGQEHRIYVSIPGQLNEGIVNIGKRDAICHQNADTCINDKRFPLKYYEWDSVSCDSLFNPGGGDCWGSLIGKIETPTLLKGQIFYINMLVRDPESFNVPINYIKVKVFYNFEMTKH